MRCVRNDSIIIRILGAAGSGWGAILGGTSGGDPGISLSLVVSGGVSMMLWC
jgi:hypothetical protein